MSEPLPATAARLRDLAEDGALAPARSEELQRFLRARLPWQLWTERLLLVLGAGLLLAGVLFFFAYNWATMPPWQKLATVETALALCAGLAAWRGLGTLAGQVGVFAACVLVGVFLAVFGQIYQTGADAYELFVGWAALILPWVLLARFGALWLLWLLLLNLALGFSWQQSNFWQAGHLDEFASFSVVFALLNGAALAAREVGAARGLAWLREEWLRAVPISLVFAALTAGNWWLIFGVKSGHDSALAPVALLAAASATYFFYRKIRPNLFCLAVMVFSLCLVLVSLLARLMFEHGDSVANFFTMAIVVLAVFGGAVAWLRHEGRAMEKARQEAQP